MRGITGLNLSLLLALFQLAIQSQTIWTIQNPQPPFDEYQDVHFVNDQLGWAVGEEGHVIGTDDGGLSWNLLTDVFPNWLECVQFVNADTGWVAGDGIYKTMDGGSNWEHQIGNGEIGVLSMQFLDDQLGFAGTGGGEIYKTSNGGEDWGLIYDEGFDWVNGLYFYNENEGWAMSRNKMRYTSDGGGSWTESLSLPYFAYGTNVAFQFIDEDKGWIVTDEEYIFTTADGGISWDTLIGPYDYGYTALHFFDELNGLVFSSYSCYITGDGGLTFGVAGGDNLSVKAVHFPNDSFGCTVGDRQQYSLDAGHNWTRTDIGHTHDQFAVWLGPQEKIVTGGVQGKLMYSEDNGQSWEALQSPTGNTIRDFCPAPGGLIWGCGDAGTILFSEDEGISWSLTGTSFSQSFEAISFADQQHGLCVGHQGTIARTEDGGINWELNFAPSSEILYDVSHINANVAWACGEDGYLVKTNDAGTTWTEYNPDTNYDLYSICFVSEQRGWISSRGTIYSTFDGGENWITELEYVQGIWNDNLLSIAFQDSLNGWVVGEDGQMLHTRDGGTNWSVHESVIDEELYDVAFRTLDEVCALGAEGNVLYTDQGSYLAPHVVSLPPDTLVCEGEEVVLICEATGDSLNYQWLSGGEELPGETNPALVYDSISVFNGGLFSCSLSNGAGTLYSDEFLVSVKPQARVIQGPDGQTVHETDTLIFNQAVVGGLPVFYQWQKNGEDIPGANQHIYVIYGVQLSDSGNYNCIVSNSCSIDTTELALLTILPASSIDTQRSKSPLQCYPNPVTNQLHVRIEKPVQYVDIQVFSLQGIKQEVGKSQQSDGWNLDLGNLHPGVYMIVFSTEDGLFVSRIVKMKQE